MHERPSRLQESSLNYRILPPVRRQFKQLRAPARRARAPVDGDCLGEHAVAALGYAVCDNGNLEAGFEKIALFARGVGPFCAPITVGTADIETDPLEHKSP